MAPKQSQEVKDILAQGAPEDANIEAGLPTSEEREAATQQDGEQVARYRAADLVSDPTVIGEEAHVVAGAFHDAEIGDDDRLTANEAESVVAKFRARTAKNDEEG